MSANGLAANTMFFFERKDGDLPYYRRSPNGFSLAGWVIVLAAVAVSFVVLIVAQQLLHSGFGGFIPPLLFVLIPFVAVAAVGGSKAPFALFRPLGLRDIGLIVLFFLLNVIVTIVVGTLINSVFHTVANPAGDMLTTASGLDKVLFFGWSAVQLLGEEIFTVLIFLGSLALLHRAMPRKRALCLAVLVASIIFGLAHLPTYQGNMAQAAALIPIRIVLLLPYLITRNIWVSTSTHILNDWTTFGMVVYAGLQAD